VATRSATDSSIEAYGIRGIGRREMGWRRCERARAEKFKCKDVDLNLPRAASYE